MEPAADHVHEKRILGYLSNLYAEDRREFSFDGESPEDVERWQERARPELRRLLGLDRMEDELAGHSPTVELDEPEQLEGFTRRLGRIETEPGWSVEFWMLRPDGEGPFPLAVMPHGHAARGHDIYAGVHRDDPERIRKITTLDADVGVQGAREGFLAITVNTRGWADNCIPDLNERHDGRDCHSEQIHALLAGRTAVGQRAWDLERVIDWAVTLPEADAGRLLMMGNSGGGMATTYAAACDTRVVAAVPSCSFSTYVGANGLAHHCDCNCVPGIYRFGEFSDVAGLIAPRHLLMVHGREDPLFPHHEVERPVEEVAAIYEAAGVAGRFEHRWGPKGHQYYSDLMWPWVREVLSADHDRPAE